MRRGMSIPVYFWFPVLGCIVFGTFFMNIPPVADQFMAVFGVGYAGLSFFLSSVYWTHSLFQVPGGLAVDRLGIPRALLLCLAVMIAANLIPFLAPESLTLAVAMRLVLGLVTGAGFLAMIKIIKLLTPPNFVARMQGMHGAAFCLGTLAPYLYLPLAGEYGWVMSYCSGALFCVVVGLCMFRLPTESLNTAREPESLGSVWRSLRRISTSGSIWRIGLCHGFFFGTINTLGNWLPSILADARANSTVEDWAVATGVMLFLGTMGRMFGSEIMGFTTRWKMITRVTLLVGICYWVFAFCTNAVLFLCLALALAVVCGLTFASVFTLLLDVAIPAYVSTTVGFMNMIANGVNILLILLWGTVREYTGSFAPGLCISGGCAVILWFWARRRDPEAAISDPEGRMEE